MPFPFFAGQTWARVAAIVLVILSAVEQLLLIPAQPWWSLIVIAIDVLVVYALIVHGREMRDVSQPRQRSSEAAARRGAAGCAR